MVFIPIRFFRLDVVVCAMPFQLLRPTYIKYRPFLTTCVMRHLSVWLCTSGRWLMCRVGTGGNWGDVSRGTIKVSNHPRLACWESPLHISARSINSKLKKVYVGRQKRQIPTYWKLTYVSCEQFCCYLRKNRSNSIRRKNINRNMQLCAHR